jgi:hypothetical protein
LALSLSIISSPALRTTTAKVDSLSANYAEKAAAVAACKPDEGTCTIEEKNQLAL